MINKFVASPQDAISGIADGSTLFVGGFGHVGVPYCLIDALIESGATDLTVVANNAGVGETGLGAMFKEGRIRRIVCSYPRSTGSVWFERRFEAGEVELEVVPQGTLTERIRAGGAGIGGFYTTTAVGTELAHGKETRVFEGRVHLLEEALRADAALIAADQGDRWGNLTYSATARNYGPTMAAAAALTVVEVRREAPLGDLDPETVVTPGIFVDRVVVTGGPEATVQS